jgi:hypothetical protein
MTERTARRRHLRDAATICPATITVPGEGPLRCEHDAGHDGQHKHECMRWGNPSALNPRQ